MSAIREEIIKLTKFKGDDDMYEDDPQEYLAALLLAVDKMSAKEYDKLSDDAYNWHVDAVKAKDNDQDIPDFPDAYGKPPEEVADDEADQEAGEPADDADNDEDEDEADNEPAEEPAGEDPEADDSDGTEEDGPVAAEAEPPVAPDKSVKPKSKKEPKAKRPSKKPKNFKNTRDYTTLTGEVDKFGVTIGTKTHEAVKMYEKGCTAAQLEDTIGGRHYNILAKLIKDGHKVEKLEGGVWKLTHKDSIKKGKK